MSLANCLTRWEEGVYRRYGCYRRLKTSLTNLLRSWICAYSSMREGRCCDPQVCPIGIAAYSLRLLLTSARYCYHEYVLKSSLNAARILSGN